MCREQQDERVWVLFCFLNLSVFLLSQNNQHSLNWASNQAELMHKSTGEIWASQSEFYPMELLK
jgi:hypothetical protein